jgi:apolipoprotein D and lipocalin family protein
MIGRPATTRWRAVWMALGALATATGCTGVPEGVEPVRDFELERYLGTWYEIARLDHRFERGLEDVSATYTLRDDGSLTVRNRGFDPESGEWKEAVGHARPIGDPSVGSLEVSFFGPFYGGYHVIALDRAGYRDALVCGPSRDYLWILSRARTLAPERLAALVGVAREAGFPVDELIRVEHTRDDPALAGEARDAGPITPRATGRRPWTGPRRAERRTPSRLEGVSQVADSEEDRGGEVPGRALDVHLVRNISRFNMEIMLPTGPGAVDSFEAP